MPKKKEETHDFSKDDMKIYPVKPTLPPIPLKRPFNPIIPSPPTSLLFVMGSGCGKSNLITNLVFRPEYYGDVFEKILYISPTVERDNSTQPFTREEMEEIVTIRSDPQNMDNIVQEYIEHIEQNYDVKDDDKPNPPISLIIADDISGYMKRTDHIVNLVSRNRHYWASLFISNQTLRDLPRVVRTLCKGVFLARCTSDIETKVILEEYGGQFLGGESMMLRVWREATAEKYNFLFINMSNETDVHIYQLGKDGVFEFDGVASNAPRHAATDDQVPMEDEEVDPLKEEQPLYCSTCNKEFATPERLRRHEMTKKHQKAMGNFY